jgi:hypothetical protein
MKKLLFTSAALTLALATVPNFVGQSKAAPMGDVPTRSQFCDMAKSQRNPVSWNERYNCLQKPATARAAPAVERKRTARAKNPYCDMAKSQKNPVAWNARYNCLDQHAATPVAAPKAASKRENQARNPYCDMAKSQKNPVSWNAQYNCLAAR